MPVVLKAEPPSYAVEPVIRAARIVRDGGVAIFPTETVYGMGADIRRVDAVSRVFALKNRDASQPLMAHCASPVQMLPYVSDVPQWVQPLMSRFWPGPLALVFKRSLMVSKAVTGGGNTIGIRMVAHPVARDLLEELGAPMAGTSANAHGEPATSEFASISRVFLDKVDVALDAGLCGNDVPSTVLDVTQSPPQILRVGAISVRAIEAIVGEVLVRPLASGPNP